MKGLVSKETVVPLWQGSKTLKFGIKLSCLGSNFHHKIDSNADALGIDPLPLNEIIIIIILIHVHIIKIDL